ncbi:fcsB, partial [Symbiodinium necroappetens]
MASLGYHAVIGPKPSVMDLLRRGKWTDSGLVIFSRLPIAETRSIRFESGAALDAGACKGAMWARVELASGRYLDVFNCHLQASHTGADGEVFDRIRRSQLKELREFIELAGTEHPYVLTGDFNVDAIPEPSDPMGTYGIPFRPPRQESEDYQRLLHSLDPRGRLVDLLCGPTPQDPLGKESPSFRHHPCTRPPRLRMPSSAGYVARHKYPQRLDYVFYRPTLTSLVEHAHSDVEPFEVSGQPFEYLSDHFGIRAHFRFRCSFAWARDPPKCKPNEPSLLRKAVDALWKRWFEGSLLLGLLPAAYLQVRKAELLQDVLRRPFSRLGVPLALQPTLLQYGFPLACAGGCGLLLLFRRRLREEERPPLERTLSMTAELASSAFRRRLQAQSERPAKTIASSPYDSFNGSVESYRLRPCIGRRPLNSDGTLGEYTWLSYGDAQFEVLRISSGLHRKFGLKRNAQVGLLGDASADWLLCDLALMRLGANTVCLAAPASNPTSSTTAPVPSSVQDLELLLCSSDWVEYFVASRRNEELPRCPIVTFTPLTPRLAAMAQHRNLNVWDLPFIANFGEVAGWVPYVGVGGFDVMTTMYRSRSGTKSELAGVSVSLRGLAMCAHQIRQALGLRNDDRHFSYIWPAFTAERVVLHAVLAAGGAVGFFGGVRSPRIF